MLTSTRRTKAHTLLGRKKARRSIGRRKARRLLGCIKARTRPKNLRNGRNIPFERCCRWGGGGGGEGRWCGVEVKVKGVCWLGRVREGRFAGVGSSQSGLVGVREESGRRVGAQ